MMADDAESSIGNESVLTWWLATVIPGLALSVVLVLLISGAFERKDDPPPVDDPPAGLESSDEFWL